MVMAGLRNASLLPHAIAVKTPAMTAKHHPVAMTIHPEPSALDFFKRTLATTPSPRRINIRVPINSPKNGEAILAAPPLGLVCHLRIQVRRVTLLSLFLEHKPGVLSLRRSTNFEL